MRIFYYLKKFKEIFIDTVNFILLLPVYYIGIGISSFLWRISKFGKKEKESVKSYYLTSKKLTRNLKRWEELM